MKEDYDVSFIPSPLKLENIRIQQLQAAKTKLYANKSSVIITGIGTISNQSVEIRGSAPPTPGTDNISRLLFPPDDVKHSYNPLFSLFHTRY